MLRGYAAAVALVTRARSRPESLEGLVEAGAAHDLVLLLFLMRLVVNYLWGLRLLLLMRRRPRGSSERGVVVCFAEGGLVVARRLITV